MSDSQKTCKQITYKQSGVDICEGARAVDAIREAVQSTYRSEVIGDIGGFGGLFSIAAAKDMQDPVLVAGTDGVGTKIQLAKLANKHDTIGIDLVAMCANDILATGAQPLFFLDYVAVEKLDAKAIEQIVGGIACGCRQAGCALIGGEMAEHPGVMPVGDYDLSGFCVGIVDRDEMLNPSNVACGDVLIGIASSGLHSNGYSLARAVTSNILSKDEMCSPRDSLDGKSLLEELLVSTKIYVKPVLEIQKKFSGAIHSIAHITGGGITENLNRSLPENIDACVKRESWSIPNIINEIVERAGLDDYEAYKTFNMGIGMILVVDAVFADDILKELKQQNEQCFVIGQTVAGQGRVVYL